MIDDDAIFADIMSGDYDRVIDILFMLGSERETMPSPRVFQQLIALIGDQDPDIRYRAIFTLGIHWHYVAAFSKLLDVLDNASEDPLVLSCAADAIGSMAHDKEQLRDSGVRKLVQVAVNEQMPQEVRVDAYLSALWAAHRVCPNEYARLSVSQGQVVLDWGWLNSVLRDGGIP